MHFEYLFRSNPINVLYFLSDKSFASSSRTRREFRSRYWASKKAQFAYFAAFFSLFVGSCKLYFGLFPRSPFLADKNPVIGQAIKIISVILLSVLLFTVSLEEF